jgi:ABC-2 type transport system permease protein
VSRALAAELFKLRTTRTSWGVTLGSLAIVVIISTIAALAGDFSPSDEEADLLEIAGLVQFFALVLGILIVATEFRHGTITPSLLAVPDRIRLLVAKLLAALGAGALLGLVAASVCALIVLLLLSARDVDIADSTTSETLQLIAGNVAASALFAAIGVGLGALLRNQVGAIVGGLVYLFVVEPIIRSIPATAPAYKWLPGGALEAMTATFQGPDLLEPWQGAVLLLGYGLVAALLGTLLAVRRDVA